MSAIKTKFNSKGITKEDQPAAIKCLEEYVIALSATFKVWSTQHARLKAFTIDAKTDDEDNCIIHAELLYGARSLGFFSIARDNETSPWTYQDSKEEFMLMLDQLCDEFHTPKPAGRDRTMISDTFDFM